MTRSYEKASLKASLFKQKERDAFYASLSSLFY
jgi:hypothetical protein